jgi:putative ABC transport system substrate-binding protein
VSWVTFTARRFQSSISRMTVPDLAAECLRRKSDIIAVTTTPAAKAAKEATQTVPIVMVSLGDPVRTGLVNNLARPEGNVTGMSNMGAELAAKRLALLKETVPAVSKVLVLTYLVDPIAVLQAEALKEASIYARYLKWNRVGS